MSSTTHSARRTSAEPDAVLNGHSDAVAAVVDTSIAEAPTAARTTSTTATAAKAATAAGAPVGRAYLKLVLVLGTLVALGPLTIDMYLPALPQVGVDLRASDAAVQFTLTSIMLGLAFGQLLIGPVTDAVGRRRPLLIGILAHAVVSVLCALAPTIEVLSAVRVLQGFAGAAVSVVAMAVVRDLFTGRRAAGMLSHLMLVIGVAPVLAPTLGGWLLTVTNWRGVFGVLATAAVLLAALALFGLKETLPVERRRSARLGNTLRTYGVLLRDRPFVGLVLVAGLMMATLFAYVSGSSFVLQGLYGLDEQTFGLVFGLNAVGLVIASQLNPVFLRRFSPQQVLSAAAAAALVSALALTAAAAVEAPLPWLLVPLGLTVSMCGFSFPNAPALALSRHGESAGTASAVLGATQFGVAAVAAPLVGVFGTATAVPMAAIMAGTTTLAVLVLVVVVRPWQLPAMD